jgi:beta-lactamase class D
LKKLFFLFLLPYFLFAAEENFLLINGATNEVLVEMGTGVNRRVTPCSTFKIPLSLIGYDSEILQDKETPIWSFQEGYVNDLDSWRRPQNPQSWIQHSCIWYSQILTEKLGRETLQNYLQLLSYGNQDLSGGLTTAWLSSSLKISPQEQVLFIQKMLHEQLPVSHHAHEMTKSHLFINELPNGWKLFGKTGLGQDTNLDVGWFVGWVEKEDEYFIFAYNISDEQIDYGQRVPRVTQLVLDALDLRSFQKIPKAELHLHLGGSFPKEYLDSIATIAQKKELEKSLEAVAQRVNYTEAFRVFQTIAQIINTEEKLQGGVEALCAALQEDNVCYVEVRTGLKDLGKGHEEYLKAVLRGIQNSQSDQFKAQVILSLQRNSSLVAIQNTIDLALKYQNQGVIGLDISGDSTLGQIEEIIPQLMRAKEAGLSFVVHMGEALNEVDQMVLLTKLQPHWTWCSSLQGSKRMDSHSSDTT